jgi:hypothetical protein
MINSIEDELWKNYIVLYLNELRLKFIWFDIYTIENQDLKLKNSIQYIFLINIL